MIYVVLQRRSEIGKRKPQLNPGEDKWIKCGIGDGNATGVGCRRRLEFPTAVENIFIIPNQLHHQYRPSSEENFLSRAISADDDGRVERG